MSRLTIGRYLTAIVATVAMLLSVAPLSYAEKGPEKATLTLKTSMYKNKIVKGVGKLSANGDPLPDETIIVRINGYIDANVTTGPDGSYSFSTDLSPRRAGTYTFTSEFVGRPSEYTSAIATSAVKIAPPPAAKLAANASPTTFTPGTLVVVTGKLTAKNGKPIEKALLTFFVNGKAARDSTTPTFSNGTFSTYVLVPHTTRPGRARIEARFLGNQSHSAVAFSMSVKVLDEKDLEAEDQKAPEPSPSASPSPSDEPSAQPSPSESAIATPAVHPSPSQKPDAPSASPFNWWLIGFALLSSFIVLLTIGLVIRERQGRVETTDSLLDGFNGEE